MFSFCIKKKQKGAFFYINKLFFQTKNRGLDFALSNISITFKINLGGIMLKNNIESSTELFLEKIPKKNTCDIGGKNKNFKLTALSSSGG